MPRIQTKYVSIRQLASRPEASIIVRLMMACNDMLLANRSQGIYRGGLRPTEKHLAQGGLMYFVRLQMAHLHEGMKTLELLRTIPHFTTILSSCPSTAQVAYQRLLPFTRPGPERAWFEKNVATARHNLTFHYHESGKWIDWALADRASRKEAEKSSITRGDPGHLWRFHVADDVLDSIMCRKIWQIPRTADVRKEADAIVDRVYAVFRDYVDFAAMFIAQYLK